MTTEQEMERIVRSWLEPGLTTLTDDVLDPVLDQLPATPQRRPSWSLRRIRQMDSVAKFAFAAAALVVVAVVGINLMSRSGQPVVGMPTTAPSAPPFSSGEPSEGAPLSPSPVESLAPTKSPSLPNLRLPGTTASPAGDYGWQGGPSGPRGMHKVIGAGQNSREATEFLFSVGGHCLGLLEEEGSQPVRVAGFDGVVVEPFEPPVTFGSAKGNETTRAYRLLVGDRTLCLFLTWHPDTTDEEREALERILETIRAEPIGIDSVRMNFTLDEGWDTG